MRILITAGPTREFIDSVRFLSNPSSGKMGIAIAEAARRADHAVVLVLGPVAAEPPQVDTLIRVTSAAEMFDAVAEHFNSCDCLISAAAVCDYRPAKQAVGKIKKTTESFALELVPTTDILAEMGKRKGKHILVGFALEAEDVEAAAMKKMADKNLDLIVANTPEAFGKDRASALLLDAGGYREELTNVSKAEIASRLIAKIQQRCTESR